MNKSTKYFTDINEYNRLKPRDQIQIMWMYHRFTEKSLLGYRNFSIRNVKLVKNQEACLLKVRLMLFIVQYNAVFPMKI